MVKKAASGSQSGDDVEKVEDFYGVYLLVSQNPKYKGVIFWNVEIRSSSNLQKIAILISNLLPKNLKS